MYRINGLEYTGGVYIVKVGEDGAALEEKYTVAKEFFSPLGFAEGDLLSDEEFDALSSASKMTEAVSKALNVLSYSSVSRRTLTEKLRYKYKIGREYAEAAADYAVRRGYLDESSQAKRIAEGAVRSKLWGRRRVVAELCAKGYPKDVAEDAADSVPESDYARALDKLVEKKTKGAPADGAQTNKLISSLMRLGHAPSDIKAALADKYGTDF